MADAQQLDRLIEQHEDTCWRAVPEVGVFEAAVWTQRLIEAREQLGSEHKND